MWNATIAPDGDLALSPIDPFASIEVSYSSLGSCGSGREQDFADGINSTDFCRVPHELCAAEDRKAGKLYSRDGWQRGSTIGNGHIDLFLSTANTRETASVEIMSQLSARKVSA
jgi:hypothetical protein